MRKATLLALATLAGCFSPVEQPGTARDGSVPRSCSRDADCPQASADLCAPIETVCREGTCVEQKLPVVWEEDPGACEIAQHCDCQELGRGECEGGFDCRAGRCVWTCEGCESDRDCASGKVCEPGGPGCETTRRCVAGCHENTDCPEGQLCEPGNCKTCPCPGTCQAAPACHSDAECPWQTVCARSDDRPEPHCVPGCRSDENCTAGDFCSFAGCPLCEDCICIGTCEPRNGCTSDAECERGRICAVDFDCTRRCLEGCRDDGDCSPTEQCAPPPPCDACGCDHGGCVPRETTCRTDTDCPSGTVCGWTADCARACVPGCRSNAECADGEVCEAESCDSCLCNNPRCKPVASGCASDRECGPGEVCEPSSPDCMSERTCVPGCHDDAQCGPGASCLQPDCDGCPCPGWCVALPGCTSDAQCGEGMVCQSCDPAGGNGLCMPGCRSDADCGPGASCSPIVCDSCYCPPGVCLPSTEGCVADSDCPQGTVCEPGPGCTGTKQCVPGCHGDAQCRPGESCLQTPCTTCPCPGSCELAPGCIDADRDGWVADCSYTLCPNARGYCDCDDRDPRVHPGASEVCGNTRDEDCDGTVDEGCGCATRRCTSALDCASGVEYCEAGCCTSCALTPPPMCLPGECSYPGGLSPVGCTLPGLCAPCCTCPAVNDPVCGVNYATYQSPCEAACARVEILHRGPCARGEGLSCDYPGSAIPACNPGQYCRDTCPMCDMLATRCTKVGACTADWECPAGLTPPGCSAGPGRWECSDHTCLFHCP